MNPQQKHFKRQIEQLQKEGYSFDDDLYRPTRKRPKVPSSQNSSRSPLIRKILFVLLLLSPIYGMIQLSYNAITTVSTTYTLSEDEEKIADYLTLYETYDSWRNESLLTAVNVHPLGTDMQRADELKEMETEMIRHYELFRNVEPPRYFETFHQMILQRYELTISIIHNLQEEKVLVFNIQQKLTENDQSMQESMNELKRVFTKLEIDYKQHPHSLEYHLIKK